MNLEEFKAHAKTLGIKEVLEEIDTYDETVNTMLTYAIKNEQLFGYYSDRKGGHYLDKPIKRWSKSHRKFTKIKV